MKKEHKKLNLIIGALIVLIFIALSYLQFPTIESIEKYIYDTESGFCRPATDSPPRIAIIEIDDKSLSQLGPWPQPRLFFAQMVNLLDRNGVKLIGLDVPIQAQEPTPGLRELMIFHEKLKVYPAVQRGVPIM